MRKNIVFLLVIVCLLALLGFGTTVVAAENDFELSVEQMGVDYAYLEWTSQPDAQGYSVFRSLNNNSYSLIKSTENSYTFNYNLKNGSSYSYVIKAYTYGPDGTKCYISESFPANIQIGVNAPQSFFAYYVNDSCALLQWQGDPLADYYLIYTSDDMKSWSLVKSSNEEYTFTYGLIPEKSNYYKIRAVRTVNQKKRYSDYSQIVLCDYKIDAPNDVWITNVGSNSLSLEWNAVKNATGYRVYRSKNNSDYELIKTVTNNKTSNYNLDPQALYSYRIAAVVNDGICEYKSDYVYSPNIKLSLDKVDNIIIENTYTNGVKLSWDSVDGASGYRLYRTDVDGNTVLVKTIQQTKTSTYALQPGNCYQFCVKAILENERYIINGDISDPISILFATEQQLSANQKNIDKIHINWTGVAKAEKYTLKICQNDQVCIIETSDCNAEYSIINSGKIIIELIAVSGIYSTATESIEFSPINESTLESATSVVDSSSVTLDWGHIPNAIQYEVQRKLIDDSSFVTIGTTETNCYIDETIKPYNEYVYRYRVKYQYGTTCFWGNWSDTNNVFVESASKYRALIIGEENYNTVLNGPANDILAVSNALSGMSKMNWEISMQKNATRDEIIALISLAFSENNENDVSLFYYSGHGVTGEDDQSSGALMTVEYEYILIEELADLLSEVPGKIIVVLDSCGSGAAVATYGEDTNSFDPVAFNNSSIQAFSRGNCNSPIATFSMTNEKFIVLTSSAYEQQSRSTCINGIWGGVFTRAFVSSVGYDYNSKTWSETMNADTNEDDILTVNECYLYCSNATSEYQDVQVYPSDSTVKLFFK